jgi:hypothetical protein
MEYTLTEIEINKLAAILEETPWKHAQPAFEILKVIIARKQAADKAALLADEVS